MTTTEILKSAKQAVKTILTLTTEKKNEALLSMADALEENIQQILSENALDIEAAKGKINDVMIDRLRLTPERIKGMADGIRQKSRLNLGIELNDFEIIDKSYENLTKINQLDTDTRIIYWNYKNKAVAVLLRIKRRIQSLCS